MNLPLGIPEGKFFQKTTADFLLFIPHFSKTILALDLELWWDKVGGLKYKLH